MDESQQPIERALEEKPSVENSSRVLVHSAALTGLSILAVLYTLYFGRALIIPLVLAVLLNFTLRPILLFLKRFHVPSVLGAGIIVFGLFGIIAFVAIELGRPAVDWMGRAPEAIQQVRGRFDDLRARFQKLTRVAKQVQEMTETDGAKKATEVRVREPSAAFAFISNTKEFVASATTTVILLFFLLAYQDVFLLKMVKVISSFSAKKRARFITLEMERQVMRYLLTVSLINLGLGAVVGVCFYFIGLPNPALWGLMVAVMNYVPYAGAIVGEIIIFLISLFTFDSLGHALLAPTAYFILNRIESDLVTPAVLGRRFTINPAAVFIWLIFWTWIWGIPGALLAAPMLTCFKILCDNIEPLKPVGEFLGT